ncbi:SusC/RagA family TonB-linked outer membrane protein [Chryseobacterium sp. MHB01]|uniref:SusC/RagA family TonB-linked outer membrane protein n=1 Tax=Chryseobacterium sp. MHB01 TaxID=3109433 RepID=UPI002B0030C8|nr:SusC/RagA family TonB-linked outer membrane protein [Chryseobacterium sp. MHB01]MEA1849639.1 SusC/RagA family TonB-linked outer membrane protein [Chryseobacterium sp. MHB01]
MNVKLRVLSAGVLSFIGGQMLLAQKTKKDTIPQEKQIDEVVIVGYKQTTKKKAVSAVSAVTNETIEKRPNPNLLNVVQGQLAGVNITASSGQPGAKPAVVIRGVATYNGSSDPLYVIDGFPSNSDNFRSINSNDIESLEVLKDAIAISQYGNRGTNGVIVIKTKKGRFGEGKTSFRYTNQFGVGFMQQPKYSYMNAKELLKIEQQFGAGLGASLTDAEINSWNIDTDWVKYFFRPSIMQSHDLAIQSSGEKINSYTSLGYLEQDGILRTTGLKRFTVRNNINGKSIDNRFRYQINTSVGFSKNNEATSLGSGAINRNYVTGAFLGAPYLNPNDYAGSEWTYDFYNNSPGLSATPFMLIDKLNTYDNLTDETRVDVATEFSYDIMKDLVLRTRLNGQYLSTRFYQSEYPDSFNGLLFSSTPGISSTKGGNFNGFEDINNRREFIYNNLWQLDYNKKLGDHTIGVSGNFEYNYSTVEANNTRQRGLDPKTFIPNTGAGYVADVTANDFYGPTTTATRLRRTLISYFAIADYDFAGKYGLMATIRRDGSNRFSDSKQWGTFWSVGARWNINEESFMKEVDWINLLKIRGSYGVTGNERLVDGTIYAGLIPPAYLDTYAITNNTYNGGQGYALNLGYPDLQWEPTKQYNIGLDFELLKNRLRGTFEYYNRKTEKLFIDAPITSASGNSVLTRNSEATITNKGYEINIAYDLIKNNDFTLTLRGNGAYNKNVVDGIVANDGKLFFTDGAGYTYVTQNGGSLYEPFVYNYVGVNSTNGNLLFKDINGNVTENPLASDRSAQGKNRYPRYTGGFGFDVSYKGFFASTTFTYAFKVWRFDVDEENLYDVGNIGQYVVGTDLQNAWTTPGQITDIPSLNATNYAAAANSDRFLRDASYIRLRNAQIGYRLPKSFLSGTFIKDMSITLQGENLFNITKWKGYDPESSRLSDYYQYPTARLFTLGFDVKF